MCGIRSDARRAPVDLPNGGTERVGGHVVPLILRPFLDHFGQRGGDAALLQSAGYEIVASGLPEADLAAIRDAIEPTMVRHAGRGGVRNAAAVVPAVRPVVARSIGRALSGSRMLCRPGTAVRQDPRCQLEGHLASGCDDCGDRVSGCGGVGAVVAKGWRLARQAAGRLAIAAAGTARRVRSGGAPGRIRVGRADWRGRMTQVGYEFGRILR